MKELILALLLLTYTISQPGTASTPGANIALNAPGSDTARVPSSTAARPATPQALLVVRDAKDYDSANSAWKYLQDLEGGCCNNCNKICGFAIKIFNTNNYLTNMGTWYQFKSTTNPNSSQIFTLGQNADCTWSLSNGGKYLSTTTIYSGTWVGPVNTIGANERWYIERNGAYVYIQSAAYQYWYWRASSFPNYFLGYSYGSASRLRLEYFPCDKKFGWNW
jgi:hypothetical protein